MRGFVTNLKLNRNKRIPHLKMYGFTLAEVLVTLAIIGIVASMTIPNLMSHTNGVRYRSQFKKALSVLNQAGAMAYSNFDVDFSDAGVCGDSPNSEDPEDEDVSTFCAIFNATLAGHNYYANHDDLKTSEGLTYSITTAAYGGMSNLDNYHIYQLADGAILGFDKNAHDCTLSVDTALNSSAITGDSMLGPCRGFIDVNGVTGPNKEVNCTGATTNFDVETPCFVDVSLNNMTDVYPIVFHDTSVEPATNAARYVLTTAK